MTYFDSVVQRKVSELERQIRTVQGSPINMGEYFNYFTFDIIGEVGFSSHFDTMQSTDLRPVYSTLRQFSSLLGIGSAMPWLTRLLNGIPGVNSEWSGFLDWAYHQMLKGHEVSKYYILHKHQAPNSNSRSPS